MLIAANVLILKQGLEKLQIVFYLYLSVGYKISLAVVTCLLLCYAITVSPSFICLLAMNIVMSAM